MKKIILTIFLLYITILITSCRKDTDREARTTENSYFQYDIDARLYDVDEKGVLYYVSSDYAGEADSHMDTNNASTTSPISNAEIHAVDSNGNVIDTYILGESLAINILDIYDGKAYCLSSIFDQDGNIETKFLEYSFDNRKLREVYKTGDIEQTRHMVAINGYIFILGIDNNKIDKDYSLANDNDYFSYNGEVIYVIDMTSGTISEVDIELPITFSKYKDDSILIYAYDDEGGYYFITYNAEKGSFSDKSYLDIGSTLCFDVYNDYVIYNSLSTSLPNLAAASLKDMGTIEMFPNVGTNYIVCQGEYTYFRNTLQDYGSDTDGLGSDKIERIRNSVYFRIW